jgi:methionyl-tRNA formyltransferase
MINIHHEELPAYQNAQSIIWQLYNNSSNTGYTIHKIDRHIDTGGILFKEVVPITFKQNLESTVSFNYSVLWKKSSEGLVKLLENFESYFEKSIPQGQGKSYTTPSLKQYLKILRNFKKMKKVHAPNIVYK